MHRSLKKSPILPLILLFAVIICISWAGYSLFLESSQQGEISTPADFTPEVSEHQPISEIPEVVESVPDVPQDILVVIMETVQTGDTAGKILQPYLTSRQIQAMADACEKYFPLHRLRVGRPYEIILKDEEFVSLVYEIDADKKLIVEYSDDKFSTRLENIIYDVVVRRVAGTITSNLFQAVDETGETPALAVNLAEIFAWEINFIRDIQPSDSFNLLVEKRFRDGEFKGYGRILAATFTNQNVVFEAFGFRDADGFPHYYNGKGESVKRAFLKAPLSFSRISSPFSPNRFHPVLKVWRAHPGIDYAAPKGTPVKSVGSGTITFKGWGKGAGNYIAVRHNNNYETMYLHLSGFAKGLVKGKKVAQGEVIGFVGSTGYSTGSHLDFRMKKDGVYINPLTIASPRTEPVSKKDLPEFTTLISSLRAQLDMKAASDDSNEAAPSSSETPSTTVEIQSASDQKND